MKKSMYRGIGVCCFFIIGGGLFFFIQEDNFLANQNEYKKLLSNYKTSEDSVSKGYNRGGANHINISAGSSNVGAVQQNTFGKQMFAESADMAVGMKENIGFTVGGAQDMQLFRENIAAGHIPSSEVITYNGVYSDYYFVLPDGDCDTVFCPLVGVGEIALEDEESEYWVQFGLGSSIKDANFKRPSTHFVVVIDKSGSMNSGLGEYYYEGKNDYFIDDWEYCSNDEYYFNPGQRCVTSQQKKQIQRDMDEIVGQDKLALAMDALSKMISQLQPDDTIAIVTFDNGAQVVHPRISVENIDKDVLKTHLQAIRPNGGTNMEAGMQEALALLDDVKNEEEQKRIIFLTDAMPNIGADGPHTLGNYIQEAGEDDIYFSFFGVGVDFQQQFVQKMADVPGANYFFISQYYDLQRRLVDEFDYNFFPMIFDLEAKVNNEDIVDTVYGLDTNLVNGELMRVKTLFPTPPTASGYRGSIILLKLHESPKEGLEFEVSYTTYMGKKEIAAVRLDTKDVEVTNESMIKGIVLTKYVSALKEAIELGDEDELDHIVNILEDAEDLFVDDKMMREKELETLERLRDLLEHGGQVKKDYWRGR